MTTYTIYQDSTIKADNDSTGKVEFIGTDISTILTSINGVIRDGETIIIKDGIYNPPSQVIFTKSIKLIGQGKVVFNWNVQGRDLFVFNGSELGMFVLLENVPVSSNTINVTSVGSAVAGDLLLIYDDTIWNPIDYPTWKTGELHEISSISGNTITIVDVMLHTYTTTQNGSVKLIRPITIVIDGITINGADKNTDYRGIQLYYNKNSIIRNGKFENNGLRETDIRNSYNTTVENNIIGNNTMNGYGYGVSITDASAYTTIFKNYFYNSHHTVTLGGYGTIGQSRDTTLIANNITKILNTAGVVVDAHIAESFYIYNNIIYCPSNAYAVGSGSNITKFIANIVIGGQGLMIRSSPPSPIYDISNNTFIDSVQIFRHAEAINTPNFIGIKNNIIKGNIWRIVRMTNITSFIISDNQFDSTNLINGYSVITVDTCSNGIISNNFIHNAYGNGIALDSVNNTIISNNILKDYSPNQYGISISNSSYNTISNNTLIISPDPHTLGIGESGTSDYNRIFDNDLSQIGNIISRRIISSGINSSIRNNSGYKTENKGAALSVSDSGNITHELATTPTSVNVTSSIAGELVSVISISPTNFIVAIKKHDGTPGTTQTIYWNTEV